MVHALQESLRVLRPNGFLLDIRPLHGDMRLYILTDDEVILAGPIDTSDWVKDDEAANKVFRLMQEQSHLLLEESSNFKFLDYWDSWSKFESYVRDNWISVTHLPDFTRDKAELIVDQLEVDYKVFTSKKLLISRYRKN